MNVPLRSSMTPANTYVPNAQQSVQQYSALYQVCLRRTVCAEINLSPPPCIITPPWMDPPPPIRLLCPMLLLCIMLLGTLRCCIMT